MTDEAPSHLLEPHELAELGPPEAVRLPLDLVDANPRNPRHELVELDMLADNIRAFGLLQPVTVRRNGERYELLGGHRRRAAFAKLRESEPHDPQWRTIPAVIRAADDDLAYRMLVSAQVHSRAWKPREEAAALEILAEHNTLKQIGDMFHRGESWASRRLRVYADAVLSGYVQSGRLLAGVAEEFLIVRDPVTRRGLAEQAAIDRWTQPRARTEVRKLRLSAQFRELQRRVQEMIETLSTIEPGAIPIETQRDLMVLRGRIDVISGRGVRLPTIAEAQKAAGVKSQGKPTRKRRAGYKPKL